MGLSRVIMCVCSSVNLTLWTIWPVGIQSHRNWSGNSQGVMTADSPTETDMVRSVYCSESVYCTCMSKAACVLVYSFVCVYVFQLNCAQVKKKTFFFWRKQQRNWVNKIFGNFVSWTIIYDPFCFNPNKKEFNFCLHQKANFLLIKFIPWKCMST